MKDKRLKLSAIGDKHNCQGKPCWAEDAVDETSVKMGMGAATTVAVTMKADAGGVTAAKGATPANGRVDTGLPT